MKTKFAWWPVKVYELQDGCWFPVLGYIWLERVGVIKTSLGDTIYTRVSE